MPDLCLGITNRNKDPKSFKSNPNLNYVMEESLEDDSDLVDTRMEGDDLNHDEREQFKEACNSNSDVLN